MTVNYYSYQELAEAALNDPTPDNLNALGEWFERYGYTAWNGEYFTVSEDLRLYRVWDDDHENIIGYELR